MNTDLYAAATDTYVSVWGHKCLELWHCRLLIICHLKQKVCKQATTGFDILRNQHEAINRSNHMVKSSKNMYEMISKEATRISDPYIFLLLCIMEKWKLVIWKVSLKIKKSSLGHNKRLYYLTKIAKYCEILFTVWKEHKKWWLDPASKRLMVKIKRIDG